MNNPISYSPKMDRLYKFDGSYNTFLFRRIGDREIEVIKVLRGRGWKDGDIDYMGDISNLNPSSPYYKAVYEVSNMEMAIYG